MRQTVWFFLLSVGLVMPSTLPASDLLAWWKFDGDLRDSAGNNHGESVGDTSFGIGKNGQAARFDGSNYIRVPDSAALSAMDEFTIEAWIRPNGAAIAGGIVSKFGASDARDDEFYLAAEGGGLSFEVCTGIGGGTFIGRTASAVLSDDWHHVRASYSKIRKEITVCVDGVLMARTSADLPRLNDSAEPVKIGVFTYGMGKPFSYFKGYMDDVKIWRDARPSEDRARRSPPGSDAPSREPPSKSEENFLAKLVREKGAVEVKRLVTAQASLRCLDVEVLDSGQIGLVYDFAAQQRNEAKDWLLRKTDGRLYDINDKSEPLHWAVSGTRLAGTFNAGKGGIAATRSSPVCFYTKVRFSGDFEVDVLCSKMDVQTPGKDSFLVVGLYDPGRNGSVGADEGGRLAVVSPVDVVDSFSLKHEDPQVLRKPPENRRVVARGETCRIKLTVNDRTLKSTAVIEGPRRGLRHEESEEGRASGKLPETFHVGLRSKNASYVIERVTIRGFVDRKWFDDLRSSPREPPAEGGKVGL